LYGVAGLSWNFVAGSTAEDMFSPEHAGIMPMIFGTAALVILMTIMVVPVGVITAIYLTEYAKASSAMTRFIRGAVNDLAGVPAIVFGLLGLGFFISFIGAGMDDLYGSTAEPVWGKPAIIWTALTLATLTLPVVMRCHREWLRPSARTARGKLGTRGRRSCRTIIKIVLPRRCRASLPAVLSSSRGAGKVAPVLSRAAPAAWPICHRG